MTTAPTPATGETWIRRRALLGAAVAATLATAMVAGPAGAASAAGPAAAADRAPGVVVTADPAAGPRGTYVVRTGSGRVGEVVTALHAAGLDVVRTLAGFDTVVVRMTAPQADRLAGSPLVVEVTPDAPVQLQGSTYDPAADVNSMTNIGELLRADDAWSSGVTGDGVDVALVDSGVTPVVGLAGAGQVVNGPDLSFESRYASTRSLDTFGHGTFMAGLIAAHDPGVVGDPGATGSYQGIAPGARIVSVKVADAQGRSDVSQVIAGIDWVVQHAHDDGLNVRVLNLSFGTDAAQSYLLDPLAYAAEVAWRSGIVVVVSSGNRPGNQLSDPAIDPFVIAVGSTDTHGTMSTRDDVVAGFTATGTSKRRLDVVVPGVHVQGLRVPGSFIDQRFGSSGRLADRFFRGSGTSQSAALTSGLVALLLEQRPDLTPDQVKRVLTGTALKLRLGGLEQGAGMPDALRAAFSGWPGPRTQQYFAPAKGTGTLEGSRGSAHLSHGGVSLAGEKDIFGAAVDTAALAAAEAAGASWAGGSWNGNVWTGASWNGASWDGASWDGASWDGASWDGASWDGASWDGASWDGASWDGASWDGASWDGASWDGASWDGASWDSADWQ